MAILNDFAKQRRFPQVREREKMVDNYLWYIFWKLKPNNELCLLLCYYENQSFKTCDINDWEINTGVRKYINPWQRMKKKKRIKCAEFRFLHNRFHQIEQRGQVTLINTALFFRILFCTRDIFLKQYIMPADSTSELTAICLTLFNNFLTTGKIQFRFHL